MKHFIIYFLLVLGTSGCVEPAEPVMNDQQFYIDKMAARLQGAAVWLVEHGIETYNREGGGRGVEKGLEQWGGVQQWVEPVINDRFLAVFRIKARQMNADVRCIKRTTISGVFEYWLVQFYGPEWAKSPVGKDHCLFLITQTDHVGGVRRIVHQEKQFFPSYKVNERVTVSLPLDNLELQYDMMAWLYPESYPDSDLKNWEVGIESDGRYVRVPANR